MKTPAAPQPTFLGAIKNIGRGLYTRTAKFAGYSAASPGTTRPVGSRIGTNTNSTFAQMQRVGMSFTAEMVTKDNPLASAYLAQRQNYCSSQMIYIPSTPDAGLNKEITQYLHGYDGFGGIFSRMGVACTMQDAFMRTADLETPVRGDAGLIWWRESDCDEFRLIEFGADQLGEIYSFTLSRRCSLSRNEKGELCEVSGNDCAYYQGRYFRGAECVAYKIYERTESWYGYGRIYPASDVLYFRDPASFRGVRGVTAFANSIAHMQKSEDLLQAALSAAQRQARTYGRVFNESGESDEPSYETASDGRITFFEKVPGAPIEEYYFNGDSAEFAAPNTPSAEVISGVHTAQELACLGLRMPFAFLVNPNAVGGAPSRLEVEKADKEFQRLQNTIHRPHLRTIANVVLMDAIQRKEIRTPWGMTADQFKQGRWMLPVSPSVDAFYDCKENIDMMRAGLEAPQDIIAETNRNADDVLRKTKEWSMKVQMARQDANKELIAAGYKGEVTAMDIAQTSDNPPQQDAQGQGEVAARPVASLKNAAHDVSDEKRADDGKWSNGGGSSEKSPAEPKAKKSPDQKKAEGDQRFEDAMKGKSEADQSAHRAARSDGVAIPPAWTEVTYYGKDADTFARGRDEKGRRQVAENKDYRQRVSDENNARIRRDLKPRINEIREQVKQDAASGSEEAKVLHLILNTGFRNGGEGDGKAKIKAYGASTLTGDHVKADGGTTHFDFLGKKGVRQQHSFDDPIISEVAKSAKPGAPIFSTNAKKVLSAWQNKYGGVKVHDIRHIVATELAEKELANHLANGAPKSDTERKKIMGAIAKTVGAKLGNNPAQALSTYIDPAILAEPQVIIATENDDDEFLPYEDGDDEQNLTDAIEAIDGLASASLAEWDESKHTRADDGKFGTGAGHGGVER